ncbi:FRG domain-containing protein [Burkholderia gladioli]|uniref:FRG domain-containing protein n=1 Tax=Burkholderia gladioli TaxID=28095 RepID=UPI0013F62E60|nr:FRG domain-containing protein [Burkholderia gladioli]NHH78055.1 hypothetical protein [Burkholderia gladioli]
MTVTITTKRTQPGLGEAKDLSEFLKHVDQWVAGTTGMGFNIVLFRGQEDIDWPLMPGIGREQYRKRIRPDTEARMLKEFKQRAVPHLELPVALADADWLAIEQHHGMPTRLLDWTGSALAALWFAIKQPARIGKDKKPCAAAVWLLTATESDTVGFDDAARRNPLDQAETKLLKPRHVSKRISAQDGWFSVHHAITEGLTTRFVALDHDDSFKKQLSFIRIPPDAFGPMRAQLQVAGINRGVLFPDLDGVAGRITDAFLYPDDQAETGYAGNLGEDH